MLLKDCREIALFGASFFFIGCATFEPGLSYQDLMRDGRPTVRQVREGLEVSVEEFVTAKKSLRAFDADIAPYGALALFLRIENKSAAAYTVRQAEVKALLGDQSLSPLRGVDAARRAATRDTASKALAWTVATGPFALLLWPVTVSGSGSHTQTVNQRIERHFENLELGNILVRANQGVGGFLYFAIPGGMKKLERLTLKPIAAQENGAKTVVFELSLPALELSTPVSPAKTPDESN